MAVPLSWNRAYLSCLGSSASVFFQSKAIYLGAKTAMGVRGPVNDNLFKGLEAASHLFHTVITTLTTGGLPHKGEVLYDARVAYRDQGNSKNKFKLIHGVADLVKECGYAWRLGSLVMILPEFRHVGFLIHGAGLVKESVGAYRNFSAIKDNSSSSDANGARLFKHKIALAANVGAFAVSVLTLHNLAIGAGVMLSVRGVQVLSRSAPLNKTALAAFELFASHLPSMVSSIYDKRWKFEETKLHEKWLEDLRQKLKPELRTALDEALSK